MKKYLATNTDIDEIVLLIENGKEQMRKNNFFQWNKNYPNVKIIKKDIELKRLWLYGAPIKACVVCYSKNDEFFIERLVVHSNYSGKGLGKKILKELIAVVKQDIEIKKISVVTSDRNLSMKKLLTYHNFENVGTFKKKNRAKHEIFIEYQLLL